MKQEGGNRWGWEKRGNIKEAIEKSVEVEEGG